MVQFHRQSFHFDTEESPRTHTCPGHVSSPAPKSEDERLTDALHEERSLIGQADRRARAHLPESLSEHFGGEVVASPYLPPIV